MSADVLTIERSDSVVTITIDRAPVNALPPDVWQALATTFDELGDDLSVRAIVLTGGDGRFCAGADIRVLTEPEPDADRAAMLTIVGLAAERARACRVPIIAAIDGPAHGGGLELALACDLRIGSSNATFAAAGVNMGLIASVRSLAETVGEAAARHMLLTAQRIDAEQALHWNVITELSDDPLTRALELADQIAAKPPLAVEATKKGLNALSVLEPELHDTLVTETFRELADSADHAEAIAAFLDKRPGTFTRE